MPGGIGLRCGGMDVSIQGLDRVLESEDLVAKPERDRFALVPVIVLSPV